MTTSINAIAGSPQLPANALSDATLQRRAFLSPASLHRLPRLETLQL